MLHIYPKNADVNTFNETQLLTCEKQITVTAADITHTKGGVTKRKNVPVPKPNTMLQANVSIAKSARVTLRTNLDVTDGLSNGVMGTVRKISTTKTAMDQPDGIWIEFDRTSVGLDSRHLTPPPKGLPQNCVLIKPHTEQFTYQGINITRHQYPLKLAWACTVHKTQGMSKESAVVSSKETFQAGMQYVALSRVTSLQGLHIIDFNEHTLYCDQTVTAYLNSMSPFNTTSTPLLRALPTEHCWTIIMHNIHSLKANFHDLLKNPEMLKGDVIAVCETWLKKTDPPMTIPGYGLIRCDRHDNSGRGGTAMFITDTIPFMQVTLEQTITHFWL